MCLMQCVKTLSASVSRGLLIKGPSESLLLIPLLPVSPLDTGVISSLLLPSSLMPGTQPGVCVCGSQGRTNTAKGVTHSEEDSGHTHTYPYTQCQDYLSEVVASEHVYVEILKIPKHETNNMCVKCWMMVENINSRTRVYTALSVNVCGNTLKAKATT